MLLITRNVPHTIMKFLLFPALLVFSLVLGAQSASYFINEISYAASNPTEKGFEIAGTAGNQITGWSVIHYDADGLQHSVDDLSNQIIPNQQNGYGTIWYDIDQAGDTGGIALVNANGTVEQFVAYGGLTGASLLNGALDGPAAGVIPEFIGSVDNPTASLQLVGSGNLYPAFLWVNTQVASLGQVNNNQLFILSSLGLNAANSSTAGSGLEAVAWPNPTTDFFQVKLPEDIQAENSVLNLYDQNGRQLVHQQLSQERQTTRIDVSHLPAGMYYLTVNSNNNSWHSEVVIQ